MARTHSRKAKGSLRISEVDIGDWVRSKSRHRRTQRTDKMRIR